MTSGETRTTKGGSFFPFSCGCRNARSVSVSASTSNSSERSAAASARQRPMEMSSSSGDTLTTASSSINERERDHEEKSEGETSYSELLRELRDLEQSVKAWKIDHMPPAAKTADTKNGQRHRRSQSEGRVEESVAVVKDSADPLRDFKQSMLQMIVEKEIVDGKELRELLLRFLSLNSARYHGIILRAFAEIWAEVFSGYVDSPDLLSTPEALGRSISQHKLMFY